MFDNYFTYWDDLPDGSGFELYSAPHIMWLTVIAVGVCAGVRIYIKKTGAGRRRLRSVMAAVMAVMELYKDAVLTVTSHMEVQYLPLQLCGLAIIVELCFVLAANVCDVRTDMGRRAADCGGWQRVRTFLGEVMCILCMPGALAALLFPDWTRYPVINFMSLHSFILHGMLVLLPAAMLAGGEVSVDIRRIYMPAVFLACAAGLVYPVNIAADCNFMFLRHPSNSSPFEAVYRRLGYGGYLLTYGLVVVLAVLLMYGIYALILRLLLDENCAIK